MEINDLLTNLTPNANITILNESFTFAGQIELTIETGEVLHWLFSEEGHILVVAQTNEEFVFFQVIEEEIEPEDNFIFYQSKEYEFNYEGNGQVTQASEGSGLEIGDHFSFDDYERDNGEIIRLLTNLDTGEIKAYLGRIVVEDDILNLD